MIRQKVLNLLVTSVLILIAQCFISAQIDSTRINLGISGSSISEALKKIKKESGVSFAFNARALKIEAPFIAQKERELGTLLDLLLEGSGYSYKIFQKTIAIIPSVQKKEVRTNVRVSGKVLNVQSGETLPFTAVRVKGSSIRTVSNQDGYFTLDKVPTDSSTLILNFIGFETTEYRLSPGEDLLNTSVYLNPVTNSLPEARVVETEGELVRVEPIPSVQSINISTAELAGNNGLVDPFRPLQLLPGIDASSESNGGLSIRGAGTDQVLILFDGFTIYHVDHLYGIFSAFNPESIKHMRLSKGSYEARLGGRGAGILEITGKEGNRYNSRFSAGLNLLTADLTAEVPLFDGNGSIVLTGRRAYTDVVPTYLFKDLFNTLYNSSILQGSGTTGDTFDSQSDPLFTFHDVTARLTYDPGKNDHLNLSFYQGRDRLELDYSDPLAVPGTEISYSDLSSWGNTGASLRWGHRWNSKNYTNIIGALSQYRSDLDTRDVINNTLIDQSDTLFTRQESNLEDRTLRIQHELSIPGHKITGGLWLISRQIDYRFEALSEGEVSFLSQQGNTVSAFLQDDFDVRNKWNFNIGMRVTYHDLAERLLGEPRFALVYNHSSFFAPKLGLAWQNQNIRRIRRQNLFLNSPDLWRLSNVNSIPTLSSVHLTGGASGKVKSLSYDIEFYYRESTGEILDPLNVRVLNDQLFLTGEGRSYGMDILVQYSRENWRTQLSYSYAQSLLRFDGVNANNWIHSPFDNRHQIKTQQHYRLNNWDLSASFVFSSGNRFTPSLGLYTIELINGNTATYNSFGVPFSGQLPAYHRLDLSANYRFRWESVLGELGFSIYNVYDRNNLRSRVYRVSGPEDALVLNSNDLEMLGILPSLSIRFTWE